jgi:hypothetical protein
MSLTTDINNYWKTNSILYSTIPASSFYVNQQPDGAQVPLAVLENNVFSSDYTCGDPYVLTYDFTISVWTNSLVTTQQMSAVIISQFQGLLPVPNCCGCWHENTHEVTEEHNQPIRYGYGAIMAFRLIVTKTLSGEIIAAMS